MGADEHPRASRAPADEAGPRAPPSPTFCSVTAERPSRGGGEPRYIGILGSLSRQKEKIPVRSNPAISGGMRDAAPLREQGSSKAQGKAVRGPRRHLQDRRLRVGLPMKQMISNSVVI